MKRKLLGPKLSKSYFEILFFIFFCFVPFFFLDFLISIIVSGILLSLYYGDIQRFSNILYMLKDHIIIYNPLHLFKPYKKYGIAEIKEIKVNQQIKGKRKWNIVIFDKNDRKDVYFFQFIGDEELFHLKKEFGDLISNK